MLEYIDRLLDRITMYRLLLYYLIGLVLAAMGLSLFHVLEYSIYQLSVSTVVLVTACWVTNKVLAFFFRAPTNFESSLITALILDLIIAPFVGSATLALGFMLAASGLAMASKYILTVNRKHIFNPAAIAVVLTALGPRQSANWWVGTSAMLPFVVSGGLLLARKIHRERMIFTFFGTTLVATVIYAVLTGNSPISALDKTIMTSAMFFLGFVMLTEPLTTPPNAPKRTWYAVCIGIMFPPQFHIFSIYSTPELALVVSNFFSFIISPKVKLFPTLKKKVRIAPDCVDFVFTSNRKFTFQPGQYMEWTLPHTHKDSRGDRRYFTLASSPTEKDLRIGVKFYEQGSSYKKALREITSTTPIVADQISGDFTLPKDLDQKLVFIAGGIGITPFRSMLKYLIDRNEQRTVTLFYSAKTKADFSYTDVFEQARRSLGIQTIYAFTGENKALLNQYCRKGRITADMIQHEVPDYMERVFYISGTQAMTQAIREMLHGLGVPMHHIKVDYFSGYS